ncbi:MAG TPA: hypothetical protein VGL99_01450 [Chloroflexota bacterium]
MRQRRASVTVGGLNQDAQASGASIGVTVEGDNNRIGGTGAGEGNVISGNSTVGLRICAFCETLQSGVNGTGSRNVSPAT